MTLLDQIGPAGPAEALLPCADLPAALDFFVGRLGFRVETIFPADEPRVASLSGHGLRLRLEPGAGDPGAIRLACAAPGALGERTLTAPNGTRIELVEADPAFDPATFTPELVVTRADAGATGEGRAGMGYRDLLPSRLGGRFIASHITIEGGGPVADWPHFHKIGFQIIYCRRGWVRVVYEDQGEPFVMQAGDCVVQPPRIRHRVLESSPGLEVVEIGSPAVHETLADHDMVLPTGRTLPDRDFGGQRFLRHVAAETPWTPLGEAGFEQRETGVGEATRGAAQVRSVRAAGGSELAVEPHAGELMFGFVLEGSAVLGCRGDHPLAMDDCFAIPPGEPWKLRDCSPDLVWLEVSSPPP